MTESLPILPLQTVIFPGMRLPISIFEERYRRMLDAIPDNPTFGIILLRSGRDTDPVASQATFTIGTSVRVTSRRARPGGIISLIVEGTERFVIHDAQEIHGYRRASIALLGDEEAATSQLHMVLDETVRTYLRFVEAVTTVTARPIPDVRITDDPITAAWDIASRLPMTNGERQVLLESTNPSQRLVSVQRIVRREVRLIEELGLIGIPLDQVGRSALN